jgi:hypothetical protein
MKTLLKHSLTQNLRWRKIVIVVFLLLSFTGHSQSWQWVKRGGSTQNPDNSDPQSELVRFLETDNNGNIYVTSPVTQFSLNIDGNAKVGYGYKDNVLASFACDGTYRWSTVIGGPEDSDNISNIKVDSNGDVYALLTISWGDQFEELFHFDATTTIPQSFINRKRMCIAKYNGTTGNVLWYKFPQADGLTGLDYLQSGFRNLILDTDGSLIILALLKPGVYFNGQFNNTATGTNNFIIKCNANGDFISAVQINTEMNYGDNDLGHPFQFLKHPINGKYYIYGYFQSFNGIPLTGAQAFKIVCIAPTGVVEWTKSITNNLGQGNNLLETFEIDADGWLYVGGATGVGNSFGTYTITAPPIPFNTYEKGFLVKLDPSGNVIWGTNATVTPANGSQCNVLHVKGNEVAVSPKWHGITWGGSYPFVSNAGTDASLYIFDKTTGAFINNTRMSSTGGTESFSAIKTDVFNNYVLGGYFNFNISAGTNNVFNNGGGSDFFVAKYGLNNGNCALATVAQNETEKVMLYPNPATTELFVNTQEKISYIIYNILGKKVANGEVENTTTPIAISHLANGNYVIQIKNTAGEVKKVKFLKI